MHPGGMKLDSYIINLLSSCININMKFNLFEDQNGITMTSFNLEPTGVLKKNVVNDST